MDHLVNPNVNYGKGLFYNPPDTVSATKLPPKGIIILESLKNTHDSFILDCPSDMIFGSQCYHFLNFTDGVNMTVARQRCIEVNLTLATVHSLKENAKISSLVQSETFLQGGFVLNKSWVWLDGTGWDYSNWGQDQPQPSQGTCIIITTTDHWRAAKCSETVKEVICKLKKGAFDINK